MGYTPLAEVRRLVGRYRDRRSRPANGVSRFAVGDVGSRNLRRFLHEAAPLFLMPISPSNLHTMMQPFHAPKVPFSAPRSRGCDIARIPSHPLPETKRTNCARSCTKFKNAQIVHSIGATCQKSRSGAGRRAHEKIKKRAKRWPLIQLSPSTVF